MRFPRLLALPGLCVSLILASSAVAQAQSKFAVIELRRAVLETEDGLRVQANLKKLFDSRQVELEKKELAVKAEREKLEKDAKGAKGNTAELQAKYEKLQQQFADLQTLLVNSQKEMQRKETELTNPIVGRIMAIIRRVSAQDGYDLVVDKAAAPYFRSDLEITDKVIQLYNSGDKGTSAPAAPAPAPAAAAPAKK